MATQDERSQPLRAGMILEKGYRIVGLIGSGAFGRVYKAWQPSLNRHVAIKELRRDAPGMGTTRLGDYGKRFDREAQVQAQFNHPNIVHVYELLGQGEPLYLVTEYVDGPNLRDYLAKRGPLPLVEVVCITQGLLEALAQVHEHEQDVVHRDVKPSNILLTKQGVPKLTDFGLAQLAQESDRSRGIGGPHPGTPMYMSPEQAETTGYLHARSDLYSLGCVLFEMLTAKTAKKYVEQGRETPPSQLRRGVPHSLDEVVLKCLQQDPVRRYQTAAEVSQALSSALYREGRDALGRQDWAAALSTLDALVKAYPDYRDARQLRDRAREENSLSDEYRQAEDSIRRREWGAALSALDALANRRPGYRDVQDRLKRVRDELSREAQKRARSAAKELRRLAWSRRRSGWAASRRRALRRLGQACDRCTRLVNGLASYGRQHWEVFAGLLAAAALVAALILAAPYLPGWVRQPYLPLPSHTPVAQALASMAAPTSVPDQPTAPPVSLSATPAGQTVVLATATPPQLGGIAGGGPPDDECPPPAGWLPYTVSVGDTLSGIALRSGSTVDELRQANCLTEYTIRAEQTLYVRCIPQSGWTSYTVKADETLWQIAVERALGVADLQWANCLPTDQVLAGQVLLVPPPPTGAPEPTRTATRVSPTKPARTSTPLPGVVLTRFDIEYAQQKHSGCAAIAQWAPPDAALTRVQLEIYAYGSPASPSFVAFSPWQGLQRAQMALQPGEYYVKITWVDAQGRYVAQVPALPPARSGWHLRVEPNNCSASVE